MVNKHVKIITCCFKILFKKTLYTSTLNKNMNEDEVTERKFNGSKELMNEPK